MPFSPEEKRRAHNNAWPYSAPARDAVITVPGPINAAVTRNAGPDFESCILIPEAELLTCVWCCSRV